jgi:hypothetical protein
MEQRREVARKARGAALGPPGTSVCMQVNVGAERVAILRGVTAGLKDNKLNVKITAVDTADPELLASLQSGATVEGGIWEWTPCL